MMLLALKKKKKVYIPLHCPFVTYMFINWLNLHEFSCVVMYDDEQSNDSLREAMKSKDGCKTYSQGTRQLQKEKG